MSPLTAKNRARRDPLIQPQCAGDATMDADSLIVEPLVTGHETEVLDFLNTDPIHNAITIGLIRDNGLESVHNRGKFYSCRNADRELTGVALVGHVTLFSARNNETLAALAKTARHEATLYSTTGEQESVERFWRSYARGRNLPHSRTRELLLELRLPCLVMDGANGLRLATVDDLEPVVSAHAKLTHEEIGVNPLEVDPVGFRHRCLRRIQQRRVWVWIDQDRVKFKAEIISDIPGVVYLEGVFVNSLDRGKGIGSRYLSHLSHILLSRMSPGGAVSVLVNRRHYLAQAFYSKIGFKIRSNYLRITLQR
jgi:predicted GNAT family acetyltransferase